MIRYGQILISVILLCALAYLGLSWASHMIGFCMTTGGDCQGPFYHVRHFFGVFVMSAVLVFILMPIYWSLKDRWKKDVEKAEAAIQERKKQKAIEEFRAKG